MNRKRYLLPLLVGGAEAGTILGVDQLRHGSVRWAGTAFLVALALVGCGVWNSVHTREYARTKFPPTRPPTSWIVAFVGIGALSLVFGAYLVLNALNVGIALAVWRGVGGVWMLFISSALSIGCYHLWRDVPSR